MWISHSFFFFKDVEYLALCCLCGSVGVSKQLSNIHVILNASSAAGGVRAYEIMVVCVHQVLCNMVVAAT